MTHPTPPAPREYEARARSTDVFGRVLCDVRMHHYIVDGPVQNDCPGEEVTPGELFLSAVASCGIELVQVIARENGVPIPRVRLHIRGVVDRGRQSRSDLTTFNSVHLDFRFGGVTPEVAAVLVSSFQKRCPLYGTVAAAIAEVVVTHQVEESDAAG